MVNPNEDGVTHINVYSKGNTKLGRQLSNFSHTPFIHPEDGHFKSVEGYWYWLSTKDDKLRSLYGYKAKEYGRSIGGKDWLEDDEFKRKIRLAIRSKIDNDFFLKSDFLNNKLPLKHYYVYSSKIIEPKEGMWVIEYLEQLKDEFKFEENFK